MQSNKATNSHIEHIPTDTFSYDFILDDHLVGWNKPRPANLLPDARTEGFPANATSSVWSNKPDHNTAQIDKIYNRGRGFTHDVLDLQFTPTYIDSQINWSDFSTIDNENENLRNLPSGIGNLDRRVSIQVLPQNLPEIKEEVETCSKCDPDSFSWDTSSDGVRSVDSEWEKLPFGSSSRIWSGDEVVCLTCSGRQQSTTLQQEEPRKVDSYDDDGDDWRELHAMVNHCIQEENREVDAPQESTTPLQKEALDEIDSPLAWHQLTAALDDYIQEQNQQTDFPVSPVAAPTLEEWLRIFATSPCSAPGSWGWLEETQPSTMPRWPLNEYAAHQTTVA